MKYEHEIITDYVRLLLFSGNKILGLASLLDPRFLKRGFRTRQWESLVENLKREMIDANRPLEEPPALVTTESDSSVIQNTSTSLWDEFDVETGQVRSQVRGIISKIQDG